MILLITTIVAVALLIFMRLNRKKPKPLSSKSFTPAKSVITSQDIKAIAGDDVMATQLDLARAYVEMGKKQLAKKILQHVVTNGDISQKEQAQRLIEAI